jgi:hypothetical protein
MVTSCLFCDHPLPERDPAVPPGGRRAYDSWQGRLWDVCTVCSRWNPVPLVLRWEILEECERASTERGTIRLSTDQLALIEVDDGELIRVGAPPRLDLVGWRYGSRLPKPVRSVGFWRRLFGRLPTSTSFDYQPYGLGVSPQEQAWFASPFVESAAALTAVFSAAPLAPECPSCTRPLGLFPWDFQRVGLIRSAGIDMAEARCAFCRQDVLVPLRAARPAIRLALSLVEPSERLSSLAEPAAREIDAIGGSACLRRCPHREPGHLGRAGVPRARRLVRNPRRAS